MAQCVLETNLAELEVRRGKVRDIYDLGEHLLLVATDRISAFDWVLPTGIPDKGRVLTEMSAFWFDLLDTPHHLISTHVGDFDIPGTIDTEQLEGRSMLVRKTEVIPFECVVRGYLAGSAWDEYQQTGSLGGIKIPVGQRESDRLSEPIFTPATKAPQGEHDQNISFNELANRVGKELAGELRDRSIASYLQGAEHAKARGILIADTKFEFGIDHDSPAGDELLLIDEALTPDSSRFWPAEQHEPGRSQPSFDKQYVRDWLSSTDWDKQSPPPELPEDVVQRTRMKYIEALELLTGREFMWK